MSEQIILTSPAADQGDLTMRLLGIALRSAQSAHIEIVAAVQAGVVDSPLLVSSRIAVIRAGFDFIEGYLNHVALAELKKPPLPPDRVMKLKAQVAVRVAMARLAENPSPLICYLAQKAIYDVDYKDGTITLTRDFNDKDDQPCPGL